MRHFIFEVSSGLFGQPRDDPEPARLEREEREVGTVANRAPYPGLTNRVADGGEDCAAHGLEDLRARGFRQVTGHMVVGLQGDEA